MWSCITASVEHTPPSSRFKHAACLHRGDVYIYGGREGNRPLKDLWKYNIVTNTWCMIQTTGDNPGCLEEHTLVSYKECLCVFGGEFTYSGVSDSPLWTLNINLLKWVKPDSLCGALTPVNRRGHSAVVANGSMHIYGGYIDLKGSNSEMWSYNFSLKTWNLVYNSQFCSNGPGARHWHCAVVHDNCMWIHGGLTDLMPKCDFWNWSFDMEQWLKVRTKPSPPTLQGHISCNIANGMLIFGGESGGTLHSDIWKYSYSMHTWQKLPVSKSNPGGRVRHAGILVTPTHLREMESHERSFSMPFLQQSETVDVNVINRPYSSPSAVCDDTTGRMFNNRISPSLTKSFSMQEYAHDVVKQSSVGDIGEVPFLTGRMDSVEDQYFRRSIDSEIGGNENNAYERSAGSVDLCETDDFHVMRKKVNDANLISFDDSDNDVFDFQNNQDSHILSLYDPYSKNSSGINTESNTSFDNSNDGSFEQCSDTMNNDSKSSTTDSENCKQSNTFGNKNSSLPGIVLNGSMGSSDLDPITANYTCISSSSSSPEHVPNTNYDLLIVDIETDDVSETESDNPEPVEDQSLLYKSNCAEKLKRMESIVSNVSEVSVGGRLYQDNRPLLSRQNPGFSLVQKRAILRRESEALHTNRRASDDSHQSKRENSEHINGSYLYLYIFGGKEKSGYNFGMKPISVWKYAFKEAPAI